MGTIFNALLLFVLVSLGLYNKVPWTGSLKKKRNFLLTVMEAGKSKMKIPTRQVSF